MLLDVIFDNPGINLDGIKELLMLKTVETVKLRYISVSVSQICIKTKELTLSRQKMHFIVSRSKEKKEDFLYQIMNAASTFVLVDETGTNQ